MYTQRHKRKRYLMGLRAAETFREKAFTLTTGDVKFFHTSFNDVRHQLAEELGTGGQIYSINILDLANPSSGNVLESQIRAFATLLTQDQRNCGLIFLPVFHSNTTSSILRSLQRTIEDRLVAHKVDISTEISLHFDVVDMHGNDQRHLSAKVILGLCEAWMGVSPWQKSEAARGKIDHVELVRIKDLRVPRTDGTGRVVGEIDVHKALGPARKVAQRGITASGSILDALLAGVPIKDGDGVIVNTIVPDQLCEFGHAVVSKLLKKLTSGPDSQAGPAKWCYLGLEGDEKQKAEVEKDVVMVALVPD